MTLQMQAGFGLIELMVSISIMVIVSAVVLIRQDSFNSAILLRSQSYELALSVREIQLSAVSSGINTDSFRSVLGLHFDSSNGNDGQYVVFRDADGDKYFDSGEAFGEQGILDPRFEISEIRAGATTQTQLSVIFVRPNFDAQFYNSSGQISVQNVQIDITRRGSTDSSDTRTIEITSTGQINVQ